MHRQASNKFNTIKQGQKTFQELIQELTTMSNKTIAMFCTTLLANINSTRQAIAMKF